MNYFFVSINLYESQVNLKKCRNTNGYGWIQPVVNLNCSFNSFYYIAIAMYNYKSNQVNNV